MLCREYREIVAAHVDGALLGAERDGAQEHACACGPCRRLGEDQKALRGVMRGRRFVRPVPPGVERRLRLALSQADAPPLSRLARVVREAIRAPRTAAGFASAAAVVLGLVFLAGDAGREAAPRFLDEAARAYAAVAAPGFAPAFVTDDPKVLEESLNASGRLDFRASVPDLRGRGYRLRGGVVAREDGRVVTLALYEGREGGWVLCRRFRGTFSRPESEGTPLGQDRIYTRGGLTFCFVQEGETVCTLVTGIPTEKFTRDLAALFQETPDEVYR